MGYKRKMCFKPSIAEIKAFTLEGSYIIDIRTSEGNSWRC